MAEVAAAEVAAPEKVTLVNTGKADFQIAKDVTLLKNSGNTVEVDKPFADKLRRAYPAIKSATDVFNKTVDVDGLKRANAALEAQAKAFENALGLSKEDQAKLEAKLAELEAKLTAAPETAALEAQVADLQARLAEFLGAGSKKDLEALQEKHADAVKPAAPAGQ